MWKTIHYCRPTFRRRKLRIRDSFVSARRLQRPWAEETLGHHQQNHKDSSVICSHAGPRRKRERRRLKASLPLTFSRNQSFHLKWILRSSQTRSPLPIYLELYPNNQWASRHQKSKQKRWPLLEPLRCRNKRLRLRLTMVRKKEKMRWHNFAKQLQRQRLRKRNRRSSKLHSPSQLKLFHMMMVKMIERMPWLS